MSILSRIRNRFVDKRNAIPASKSTNDDAAAPPDWIPMPSSWLREAYYDNGNLFVRFKSGVVCQYAEIPGDVWNGLLDAGSKGKFFHQHIKGRSYTVVA